MLIGPWTPGFVGDSQVAAELAEIGVVLLMFGVGLHFHPRDLLKVKAIAIPGALLQSVVATLLGLVVGRAFGWTTSAALVLGDLLEPEDAEILYGAWFNLIGAPPLPEPTEEETPEPVGKGPAKVATGGKPATGGKSPVKAAPAKVAPAKAKGPAGSKLSPGGHGPAVAKGAAKAKGPAKK